MPLVFEAIDEEFAAATGSNVYVSPTASRFDNPPNAFKNLMITADDADPDPRVFEIGDSYSLTWGGFGGGGEITDAVVVRSDEAPDGGGIIVFEGIDENGELAHIIWTPDFNLEQWYSDNYNPSAEPEFWVEDANPSYDHQFVCFEGSTRIATAMGDIMAGELWRGDHVLTHDGEAKPVLWAGQRTVRGGGANAPVLFTPGAIGNYAPLRLSPQHRVLVSSPQAELLFGSHEVLVPAKALVNGRDICYAPCASVSYVHFLLESHELVFAEGASCESLLPGVEALKYITLPPDIDAKSYRAVRPVLSYAEALALMGGRHPVRPAVGAEF